jgi:hypothetical protein
MKLPECLLGNFRRYRNECGYQRFLSCGSAVRIMATAENRMEEAMPNTLHENLARQLSDSIDRLQKQVEKVEFWASAITGLTQPVPGYEPESTAVARYVRPGRVAKKRRKHRRSANRRAKPASA